MDKTNELENLKKALAEERGKSKEKDSKLQELEQKLNQTNTTKDEKESQETKDENQDKTETNNNDNLSALEKEILAMKQELDSLKSDVKLKPLDQMRKKYADFDEYKDFALKKVEQNNLDLEDAYVLAKAKLSGNKEQTNNEQKIDMDYGEVKGGTQMNEDRILKDSFEKAMGDNKDVFSEYLGNEEKKNSFFNVFQNYKKDRTNSKIKHFVQVDDVLDKKL